MKHYILFAMWLICTIALVVSIIGMFLFCPNYSSRSTWMQIGYDIVQHIIRDK